MMKFVCASCSLQMAVSKAVGLLFVYVNREKSRALQSSFVLLAESFSTE